MLTLWEGTGSLMERGTEGMAASWKTTSAPAMSGLDRVVVADVDVMEFDVVAHLVQILFVPGEQIIDHGDTCGALLRAGL